MYIDDDSHHDRQNKTAKSESAALKILDKYKICYIWASINFVMKFSAQSRDSSRIDFTSPIVHDRLKSLGIRENALESFIRTDAALQHDLCRHVVKKEYDEIITLRDAAVEACFQEEKNLAQVMPTIALQEAFGLTELQLLLVVLVTIAQYNSSFRRWCCCVSEDAANRMPKTEFFLDLLGILGYNRIDLYALVEPSSLLCRYDLIRIGYADNPLGRTTTLLDSIVIPDRVVSFLLGHPCVFRPIACQSWDMNEIPKFMSKENSCERSMAKTLAGPTSRLALLSSEGLAQRAAILRVAKNLKKTALSLNLQRFYELNLGASDDAITAALGVIMREVRLLSAILVISCETCTKEAWTWLTTRDFIFKDRLKIDIDIPICLTLERQTRDSHALFGMLREITYKKPTFEEQPSLWENALCSVLDGTLAGSVAKGMAIQQCLTYEEMHDVIEETLARTPSLDPKYTLTADALTETLNGRKNLGLDGVTCVRSTTLTLESLVLTRETRQALDEVLVYLSEQNHTMYELGFGRYSSGPGLCILFTGEPGTGKTQTALILGNKLGRTVNQINLEQVADKYVGETSKILAKIFDAAEKNMSILLFDEADALFSKRTEVKSSNDRHGNQDVNFLLQRIET